MQIFHTISDQSKHVFNDFLKLKYTIVIGLSSFWSKKHGHYEIF